MITLSIILIVIVLALAFFVFLKLLKGVAKAIMAVSLLILFVLIVLGVVIYVDVAKIKKSFNDDQTVLLSHNGENVAGFVYANNQEKVLESDKLHLLSEEELSEVNNFIVNGGEKDDERLIMIIDSSYFYGSSIELVEGQSITLNETVVNGIFSCEKLSDCTKVMSSAAPALKTQIEASFDDALDAKNKLFFNLFIQKTKETKGTFLIEGIKNEKISVYPQLATLKLINIIPEKLINKVLNKQADSEMKEELTE